MCIFEEYIQFQEKYELKFGKLTIVLMEVGSFFEIYAVQNEKENVGADIFTICELFNIQVTRKNKNIKDVTRSNHLMAGFPNHSSKKFIDILLKHNYTVVLVEQVTPPPKSKRDVTTILSPSTSVDHVTNYESNTMMTIFIESATNFKKSTRLFFIGWSIFDASTGTSSTSEINNIQDIKILLDEINRIILSNNPKELVILSKINSDLNLNDVEIKSLSDFLDQDNFPNKCIHNKIGLMNPKYCELKLQIEILLKVFKKTGFLSPIEFLDLEFKQNALISYVYLIQFVYEHGEHLLNNLERPNVEMEKTKGKHGLVLASNCVNQLNLCSMGNSTSLLKILNTCYTSVGKRFFKKTLLSPSTDPIVIKERYEIVQLFHDLHISDLVKNELKTVSDIERLYRKLECGRIHPHEFSSLHCSLTTLNSLLMKINEIDAMRKECKLLRMFIDSCVFEEFIQFINSKIRMDILYKFSYDVVTENLFHKNVSSELDTLCDKIKVIKDEFNEVILEINSYEDTTNWIKQDYNDREGHHYIITSKRWLLIKTKITKDLEKTNTKKRILELQPCSQSGNSVRLISDHVRSSNMKLKNLEKQFKQISLKTYGDILMIISEKYSENLFKKAIYLLEYVDHFCACARNVKAFSLTKPTVFDETDEISFLKIDNLRHLIIENVQSNLDYVPNTVHLGGSGFHFGMILYGVNASGKSSFMKSVGLAIIMAQAGMYVPCQSMCYYPYNEIFTRIQCTDDILKGVSTFSKEIMELRNIFKRTGSNSLVIGDELCSGTESESALAIVTAGIITLVNKQTSFLFATHLHELNKLYQIKELVQKEFVCVKHLSVRYDEETKVLIYDRFLKDGPGSSLYGLEVCKAMDMDSSFLHLASIIRHEIINSSSELINNKKSVYNKKVIMNECGVCKKTNHNGINLECHHIRFQEEASTSGIIDDRFHKNMEFNLVPLCTACHDNVHSNKLQIIGWIQTSDGIRLEFKQVLNENSSTSFLDNNIKLLINLKKTNSYKKILDILKTTYNIESTEYKLKKFINNVYNNV
jgi:DNA mismatch repair protein MutS